MPPLAITIAIRITFGTPKSHAPEIHATCSRPSSVSETVRPPSIKSDNPVMMPAFASVATNEGMRSFT